MGVRQVRWPSGAAGVLERIPESHSVAVGFWFSAGSGTESDSESGFTHFVEHMLFKGTAARSALDLARQAERAGGYLNAFTERGCLCLHCTLPARNWRVAVELLGDMAFHSSFDPEEFEKEKEVVRSEALAALDDPEEDSSDVFHAKIWQGHSLSKRVAGEPEDIEKIDCVRLTKYYRDTFHPANLTISAAGSFDLDEMEIALESILRDMPQRKRVQSPAPPEYRFGTWAHTASTGQVYLVAGTVLPGSLSRDEIFALDALSCAFGETSSSRLFQNIRESCGLCYSIGSSFASTEIFTVFYVSAVSSASTFPRLWDMIRKELDKLRTSGLSEEEVSEAVAHIYGQDIVAADDTDVRMRALARQWMRFGCAEPYMDLAKRIRAVGGADVSAARDSLFSAPFSVLAYGRIGAGVRKALGLSNVEGACP